MICKGFLHARLVMTGFCLVSLPDTASEVDQPGTRSRWTLDEDQESHPPSRNLHAIVNASGKATTYADNVPLDGYLDIQSAFFQGFGTNDRACFSCHAPRGGWSITPGLAQSLFESTQGEDSMFRTNDGTTSPTADVSTLDAKRKAYALLLSKGLIRVGLAMPDNAEFTLTAVDDPYLYASAKQLSLFRRPLPSINLKFLSDVMWDGRQTIHAGQLQTELENQADDATRTHAAAPQGLAAAKRAEIVNFERAIFVAQTSDDRAGALNERGALGGPQVLATQGFYFGQNDLAGHDPTGRPFDPIVFKLFKTWRSSPASDPMVTARKAVAHGERIFNEKKFWVAGVKGFNDLLGSPIVIATCSSCHNVANAGSNSSALRMDLGLASESRRTPDLPLYTFRNKQTGQTIKVSDPGRGLISGRWSEIGCFKVPTLRGLAARAPYFHDGSAATIKEAIAYLNGRFSIGFTPAEENDLDAFLRAL